MNALTEKINAIAYSMGMSNASSGREKATALRRVLRTLRSVRLENHAARWEGPDYSDKMRGGYDLRVKGDYYSCSFSWGETYKGFREGEKIKPPPIGKKLEPKTSSKTEKTSTGGIPAGRCTVVAHYDQSG